MLKISQNYFKIYKILSIAPLIPASSSPSPRYKTLAALTEMCLSSIF